MEKQLWRVWSVSSLFTACIFHCTSRCLFVCFFQFLGYLLVHVLNFFYIMELYFEKGKYFCPGTFVGWQLQNKLFNKPGLLTGSSGQIFQIKLNYCSSAFFHLSASWTLFWSWMPDKQLCHEKIWYSCVPTNPPPPPPPPPHPIPPQRPSLRPAYLPSLIRDIVSFVRHKLWSGCEGVQAVQRLR